MPNGPFVTLEGPTFRALATEPAGSQQPPDMPRMIAHSRQLLDQGGHAWQCPQGGLVAGGLRTGQQGGRNLLGLFDRQLGFATGRTFAGQGGQTAFSPIAPPPVSHLPCHTQTAGYFRRRILLGEEFGRFPTALFHLDVVSGLRHALTLPHNPTNVTLLYEAQ